MRRSDQGQGLVEIVRDFVEAHQLWLRLVARYRKGELRFEQLKAFVGEDENSVLFRLKERCHAQFRGDREDLALSMHREALFDLAVGSLFHEAMKFRESLYQQEVYGPKVRALRSSAGKDAAVSLFVEFEKILSGVSRRLEEGLHEVEVLLEQTVEQLRVLLLLHRENGFVARFLMENVGVAEEIFGVSFDALLAELYGSPAEGYRTAGRSYLMSGYYGAAIHALEASSERGGDRAESERLSAYAFGMAAYLSREYAKSVEHLAKWAESPEDDPPELRRLAQDAVSRVGQLAEGEDRELIAAAADALLARLSAKSVAPPAARA
jgi:tetratricopeptide (TPR) repeat protein